MMKFRYHKLCSEKREILLAKIRDFFEKDEEVEFVYVHGSFIFDEPFRDIDITVYLKNPNKSYLYTVNKSVELESKLGYPVDIHTLNKAPLSFKYNIIKNGKLILVKNAKTLNTFIETTLKMYWDFNTLQTKNI